MMKKFYMSFITMSVMLLGVGCNENEEQVIPDEVIRNQLRINLSIVDDSQEGRVKSSNFDKIVITMVAVELNGPDGWLQSQMDTPISVDLLNLQDQKLALADLALDRGVYSEIRIILDDSDFDPMVSDRGCYVVLKNGEKAPLLVPSGSSSGLKIKTHFIVDEGSNVLIDLNLDVNELVKKVGNSGFYMFDPVIKMKIEHDRGAISGVYKHVIRSGIVKAFLYHDGVFQTSELHALNDLFPNSLDEKLLDSKGKFVFSDLDPGVYDIYFAYFQSGKFMGLTSDIYQNAKVKEGKVTKVKL